MNPVKFDKLLRFLRTHKIDASRLDMNLVIREVGIVTLPLLGDSTILHEVEFTDICYAIQHRANLIEVKTKVQTYSHDNKRFDIMEILSEKGFIRLDKNLLVNIPKIKFFDSSLERIYFSDDYEGNEASSIRILGKNIAYVQREVGSDRNIYDKKIEYAPLPRRPTY